MSTCSGNVSFGVGLLLVLGPAMCARQACFCLHMLGSALHRTCAMPQQRTPLHAARRPCSKCMAVLTMPSPAGHLRA